MFVHIHPLAKAATVVLFGKERPDSNRLLASIYGAKRDAICLIKAPSNAQERGYQKIVKPEFGPPLDTKPDVYAEGVVLTEQGSAAVITTADCPTLVLYESTRKRLLVTHAGRPAMTPSNRSGRPIKNIVTIAYNTIVKGCNNPDVHAYITGAICGHCFTHDQPGAEKYIEPFDQFGGLAFTNRTKGALDLVSIIKHQLIQQGVPESQIEHDGLCTKETTWLTSYRQEKFARNAIVAILN